MEPVRILIIDDEPEVRATIAEALTDSGYVALQAEGLGEALAVIGKSRPSVILLDITMPGVDGLQALPGLRSLNPTVPIIMLTANTDADVARDTLRRGAFDYIAKPFELQRLRDVVAAAVLRSGMS